MPNLSDIVEMSDALVQSHVVLDKKRCMPLKNTHSRCTLCVDACPAGALTLLPRSLEIDKAKCVNCGACTTVCPVQALMPLTPTDTELTQAAVLAIQEAEGIACFACARVMANRQANKSKLIAVECLSRVEESLLLGLVSHGITNIIMADGNCKTCKYHHCGALAHNIAYETSELLLGMGSPVRIECTTGLPQDFCIDFSKEELSAERRSLFFRTKDVAGKAARTVATAELKKAMGIDVSKKGEATGTPDEPHRHDKLLNALAEIGEPQDVVVSSRRFASLRLNESACTSCQKCVLICPTKALSKSVIPREDEPGWYFEFDASRCVRCKLCLHVCYDNALELEDVNMQEIFDFEPTLWPVGQKSMAASLRNFFANKK